MIKMTITLVVCCCHISCRQFVVASATSRWDVFNKAVFHTAVFYMAVFYMTLFHMTLFHMGLVADPTGLLAARQQSVPSRLGCRNCK